jgi:hypothetical protein
MSLGKKKISLATLNQKNQEKIRRLLSAGAFGWEAWTIPKENQTRKVLLLVKVWPKAQRNKKEIRKANLSRQKLKRLLSRGALEYRV